MENGRVRRKRVVLGANILREIQDDMVDTVLPGWFGKAPVRMGDSGHGKLSADEWRAAVTVHMPITLIRLWGTLSEDNRFFQMLCHFLYLVIVVSLVSKRSTSKPRRKMISRYMIKYLEATRQLFPDVTITPNHHLALHLPRCLELFGPPHSWWAFIFERMNGVLQRIRTNNRFGE